MTPSVPTLTSRPLADRLSRLAGGHRGAARRRRGLDRREHSGTLAAPGENAYILYAVFTAMVINGEWNR